MTEHLTRCGLNYFSTTCGPLRIIFSRRDILSPLNALVEGFSIFLILNRNDYLVSEVNHTCALSLRRHFHCSSLQLELLTKVPDQIDIFASDDRVIFSQNFDS